MIMPAKLTGKIFAIEKFLQKLTITIYNYHITIEVIVIIFFTVENICKSSQKYSLANKLQSTVGLYR